MKIFVLIFFMVWLAQLDGRKTLLSRMVGRLVFMPAEGSFCNETGDTTLESFKLTREGRVIFLNGQGTLHRNLGNFTKSVLYIRTCPNAAQVLACELFQTWRFGKETCSILEQDHALWSPLFKAFNPPLRCPLKKGVYVMTNGTIDADNFEKLFGALPVEKYYWRIRLDSFDHKLANCLLFAGQFQRLRHS